MAPLAFVLLGSAGILVTAALVTRLLIRKDASDHEIAITAAAGVGLTWLISFMAPVLIGGSHEPEIGLWIIAVIAGVAAGAVAYPAGRLLLRISRRRK